jgi:hypothetical protein
MREIKFRAWDLDYKQMDGHFYIHSKGAVYETASQTYDTPNIEIDENPNLIIMQFTGLQDKNGVEIYEGDVIDYGQGRFAEIVYWKGRFTMKGLNFSDGTPSCIVDFYTYPVVGNIHENKELLCES